MDIKELTLPKRLGNTISPTDRDPLDLYNHLVGGGDLDSYGRLYGDLDILKRVYFRKRWRDLYDLGCFVNAFRGLDRRRSILSEGVGRSIKDFYNPDGGYVPLSMWTDSMWGMVKNVQLNPSGKIKSVQFHDRGRELEEFMKGTVMRGIDDGEDDNLLEMKMVGELDRK